MSEQVDKRHGRAGWLTAAFGLTSGCGGKAADLDSYDTVPAEVRPNYCEEFPSNNRHCGSQSSEFEVADALERVRVFRTLVLFVTLAMFILPF